MSATCDIFFIDITLPEKILQRNEIQVRPLFRQTVELKQMKEESPHFRFRSLFDLSHFLLLILLIFREKIDFGSKFRVGSVYILLESYLDNNQPVK